VLEVARNLLDKGYCLYLDNWYTSPKLVDILCTRKHVVGTMRTNRKEFSDITKRSGLEKGVTLAAFRKKQMLMKWKDRGDVVLISTFHDDNMEDVTTRQGVIQKPSVILQYCKNMLGVDRIDGQLQSYKLAPEHQKKYYHKMFCHLLDVVCLNTFIIYKKKSGTISRFDFLLTLAESLGGVMEPATRRRPSESPKPSRLLGRCFRDMVPGTSKKKPARRRVVS
jgi:hypothetical protein